MLISSYRFHSIQLCYVDLISLKALTELRDWDFDSAILHSPFHSRNNYFELGYKLHSPAVRTFTKDPGLPARHVVAPRLAFRPLI